MASILRRTLERSRRQLANALQRLRAGGAPDEALLEVLEESLIAADIGPETAAVLVESIGAAGITEASARQILRQRMLEVLATVSDGESSNGSSQSPAVWLLVGVNGSGKTTTAAKLAVRSQRVGKSVIFGAADTFRAAAVEQLQAWGQQLQVPVVAHRQGGDPAAVVFDTCEAARARGIDLVLIDTAGRLHTRENLMAEVDKIRRVAAKVIPGAPHEVFLVLDGTTGQNGLRQAEEFHRATALTGLVLAKLDGTAKGGVALSIARRFGLPIRYVGTGEGAEDLIDFDPVEYVDALVGNEDH